jgi:single stranded DNA-binding protein
VYSKADINLLGRAGQDGIKRYTPSGKPIFTVSVAVNRGPKENRRTIWFGIKAFGELAETVIVKKGDLVEVMGQVDVSTWTDKTTGQPRERFEVLANDIFVQERPQTETRHSNNWQVDDIPF